MKHLTENYVRQTIQAACKQWGGSAELLKAINIAQKAVTIEFSNRMSKSAGIASFRPSLAHTGKPFLIIKLSNPILSKVSKEELDETIIHEFAHCVDYMVRGKSDHSNRWLSIHRGLGGVAGQYHQYAVEPTKRKRFIIKHLSTNAEYHVTSNKWTKIVKMGMDSEFKHIKTQYYVGSTLERTVNH